MLYVNYMAIKNKNKNKEITTLRQIKPAQKWPVYQQIEKKAPCPQLREADTGCHQTLASPPTLLL